MVTIKLIVTITINVTTYLVNEVHLGVREVGVLAAVALQIHLANGFHPAMSKESWEL